MVDCSTGCLRMVSDVSPLVKCLEILRAFAIKFGLHLKKRVLLWPLHLTERSQEFKRYMALIVNAA